MKRLPFALVAISLSIPVVACLNSSDDEVASNADDLSEATKEACNFGFAPVATPGTEKIEFAPKSALIKGKRLAFGNFDKDKKVDFAYAASLSTIQAYVGNGDGTFKKGATKNIQSMGADRKRLALTTAAVGDFDGDGIQDLVVAATSIAKDADPATAEQRVDYRVLYGKKDGSFAYINQSTIPSTTGKISFAVAGDLDGDGADDLVLVSPTGQSALFGAKNQQVLTAGEIAYANTSERVLAYVAPKTDKAPAALVMITGDNKLASITFDGTRKASPAETPLSGLDKDAWAVAGDLDQDGKMELSMLSSKLSIVTLGSQAAPLTFEGVAGRTISAVDFDNDKKSEIVYTVSDESKLYAACGYEPGAKALAAVELPIPYGRDRFIAGTPDLNGDGKPDVVTMPLAGGDLSVLLGDKRIAPAPPLTVLSGPQDARPDSGADTGTTTTPTEAGADSGMTPPKADAGKDSGTTHPVDSGTVDSGTTPPVDSGTTTPPVDSGTTTPPVDSGTTAPKPKSDAGAKPDQGDDDDTEVGDDDDDEASGPAKTKKPTTKPSSTGSVTITPKPQPQSVDDGCSAAPVGSNGTSASALGGLLAAMMLLVRRRKKG